MVTFRASIRAAFSSLLSLSSRYFVFVGIFTVKPASHLSEPDRSYLLFNRRMCLSSTIYLLQLPKKIVTKGAWVMWLGIAPSAAPFALFKALKIFTNCLCNRLYENFAATTCTRKSYNWNILISGIMIAFEQLLDFGE